MEEGVDRRVLKAVADALNRGQFESSREEVAEAYKQVQGAIVNGTAAEMMLQGRLDLALRDGEVQFVKPLTSTADSSTADRPLDPHVAARNQGGIIALDFSPAREKPAMLLAEQLPDPDDVGDDEQRECFAFTLVDLEHDLDLVSFSVPLRDLMRLIAQAPLKTLEADVDGSPPPRD